MNEIDKQRSIDYILSQGLVIPVSAKTNLLQMLHQLGWRHIFWDTGYSWFFASLTFAGVILLYSLSPPEYRASATLIATPSFFLLLQLFAETAEMASGMYELKRSFRYTTAQVSAVRVICYSLIGVLITTGINWHISTSLQEFGQLFPLCLLALFFIASLSLQVRRISRSPWALALLSLVWIFINILLPFTLGKTWETWLRQVPPILSTCLAGLCIGLFYYLIAQMLKEKTHAYAA